MGKEGTDRSGEWRAFAEVLAAIPGAAAQLMAEHQPDPRSGRCRACTIPGTGAPGAVWPCSVRRLAELAVEIAESRGRGLSS